MRTLRIVFDLRVAFNNIKPFSTILQRQGKVYFDLLSNYRTFPIAVNHINILRSSCKLRDIFARF